MGVLTPLYLAGLAALSLPIMLHLIRRTPRGRQAFSSLMFLTPSPPRLTRRSRLDHLLLLVLRLTALALLAFAFARPFLRESAVLPFDNLPGRRVAILLDTSASMRRGDLWQQAVKKVAGVLDDLGPADDVALMTFHDRLHTIVPFADEASGSRAGKADVVRVRLRTLEPSWGATDLAAALVSVAAELDTATDVERAVAEPQLVVVSDFARGSRTDALQAYSWPERVPVVAHAVALQTTNAAAQLLVEDAGTSSSEPRVRVTNAARSTGDQFDIHWASAGKAPSDEALATYVPAGQSRVLRLPRPDGDATVDRILLHGDDEDFDNTWYVVPPQPQHIKVAWLGDDDPQSAESPRFFFELAVSDDPLRKIEISAAQTTDDLRLALEERPALVIATAAVSADAAETLKHYVASGGTVLIALNASGGEGISHLLDDVEAQPSTTIRNSPPDAEQGNGTRSVPATLGDGTPPARGYPVPATLDEKRQYCMLGEIDFGHPLFAAFANPRYSDFTKIHFWRHQELRLKEPAATRVVARFDNGDPAVLERSIEAGRVVLLTSGWQPEESQLALSSKFVPLVQALIDLASGGPVQSAGLTVGQPVPLPRAVSRTAPVERPDGTRVTLSTGATAFADADQPGIYRWHLDGEDYPFAVNLAAAESKTDPMDLESLEQLGVRLSADVSRQQRAEQVRQQRDTELESRQHLWRWLIVEAMLLLVLETWLAGRAVGKLQSELSTV